MANPNCPFPGNKHNGGGDSGPLYVVAGTKPGLYKFGCKECLQHHKLPIGPVFNVAAARVDITNASHR